MRGGALKRARVMALAIALDLLLGEPPARCHPVVWMGRLVQELERRAPREGRVRQLVYGAAVETLCLASVAGPAWLFERLTGRRSWAGLLIQAMALKPALAISALFEAAGRVGRALAAGDLMGARRAVGEIVSRRVDDLNEQQVAAAAVESLAENAGDSVVAPLLYYAVSGLPGAYAYRMANTLDAMLGYRGRYEYLGKAAARLDDLLNLAPSRLTAVAIAATCGLAGGSPRTAWTSARSDSSRTASPNAGWPMAAVAGALGVRLEKVGHYALNPEGRAPDARDLRNARRMMAVGLGAAVLGLMAAASRRGG